MASQPHPPGGQEKRRRLIVDPGLQLRAQVPLFVFAGLYAVLIYALLLYPLHQNARLEPDMGIRAILQAQLFNIHLYLWPLLAVSGLLAAYIGLRRSHRVAGPLYRLHRTLNELAEGEAKPLRFRRRDECRIFEEDVAQLNQKIKLIAGRNRDILFAVHAQVKKLAGRLTAGEVIARADLEEAVKAMLAQLEKTPEISLTARR